jgi:hypothetical protein
MCQISLVVKICFACETAFGAFLFVIYMFNLTTKLFAMLMTSVEKFQLDVQMVVVLSGTLKQGGLQENFVIKIVLHL